VMSRQFLGRLFQKSVLSNQIFRLFVVFQQYIEQFTCKYGQRHLSEP
jgi:hypothetical protein